MVKANVSGEPYQTLMAQLSEIGRQLRRPNGYPFNPWQLKAYLQVAIEGRFEPGEVYRVKLGGNSTTDEITKAWKNAGLFVSDYITQVNFPLNLHDEEHVEIEIIDPGCSFGEEDGLEYLKAAGLKRPTYEHALRFAEQCGRTMSFEKKPFIIFLHESWQDPSHGRRVMCVNCYPGVRELSLGYVDRGFPSGCFLAGVRLCK
jgi:hypothetical protein